MHSTQASAAQQEAGRAGVSRLCAPRIPVLLGCLLLVVMEMFSFSPVVSTDRLYLSVLTYFFRHYLSYNLQALKYNFCNFLFLD